MRYGITRLGEPEMAEVARLQRTKASPFERGKLSAWLNAVADPNQRAAIAKAERCQQEMGR